MLQQLIEFCLANRFLVLAGTLLMAAAGVRSALVLPIDAVPDMTNTQVTVITDAGSLSPVEVEQYITYPVESTMGGLPNVQEVRSVSKFGISVVTIVFDERDRHLSGPASRHGTAPGGEQPASRPVTARRRWDH